MEVDYCNLNDPLHFLNICRVCLIESELLIPICEINLSHTPNSLKFGDSSSLIPLVNVFEKYCGVEVSVGDNKPENICESCMNEVYQAYNVFELFLQSNTILDAKLNQYNLEQQIKQEKSKIYNGIDDFSSDIKDDVLEESGKSEISFVEHLSDKENIDTDKNFILLPDYKGESSKKSLDLLFDTELITIDNDKQAEELESKDTLNINMMCLNLEDHNDEEVVREIKLELDKSGSKKDDLDEIDEEPCRQRLGLPPQFIDSSGLLRDHTYSVNENTFLRPLQGPPPRKRKIPSSLKNSKKPKSELKKTDRRIQMEMETKNDIFLCKYCKSTYCGIDNLLDHFKNEHALVKSCILCPKQYKNREYLLYHVATHSKNGLVCNICHLYFEDKESLERHNTETDHSKSSTCKLCGKTFSSLPKKRQHVDEYHGQKFRVQCTKCGLVLYKYNLKRHEQTHEDDLTRKKFLCQVCAKGFTTKYFLDLHIKAIHEGQKHLLKYPKRKYHRPTKKQLTEEEESQEKNEMKTYKCEFCPRTFPLVQSYNKHRFSHPECKSVKCPYCPSIFDDPQSYRDHRTVEHSSFICKMCGKGFPTKYTLTFHENCHRRRHECEVCSMDFSSKKALSEHKRLHTGERPYKCEHCDKAFKQQSQVIQHVKCMHTGKNHKCKICGKAFNFNYGLQSHMRGHTGEQPFPCPYCEKKFRDTVSRHKHVKHHHPEQMEDFITYKKKFQESEDKGVVSVDPDIQGVSSFFEPIIQLHQSDDSD